MPDTLFSAKHTITQGAPATILIPIFNAADEVEVLLNHLPHTLDPDQSVLLVDDGSTDPRIASLVEAFMARWKNAEVLWRRQNGGFVAAVNAGIAIIPSDAHVILLNSDTLLPEDWVARLMAPIWKSSDVASVTPLSNCAEILSVPQAEIDASPSKDIVDVLDQTARRFQARDVELPTGIGFCIALNRAFLDRLGGFDPAFGRGYGEEVDWCQRARTLGGRHVVATSLFVAHRGGASFGSEEKRKRIATAGRIVASRYPTYESSVSDWIARDPIGPERLALAIAWAAAKQHANVPIYIAHSLGGGAERALQTEIKEALGKEGSAALVLRVGGASRWQVELYHSRFTQMGTVRKDAVLDALLAPVRKRHVIYSCAVHAADAGAIPERLLTLSDGHELSLRLHDFFPISPSWNLLDQNGLFQGVPDLNTHDPAHALEETSTQPSLSHREWRTRWGRVMDAATEVTTFSTASATLIRDAYPQVRNKLKQRPHAIPNLPGQLRAGGQTLGVLGGINHAKGGTVLQNLSRIGDRRIAVIGELEGCFNLPPPHIVHGRYEHRDIGTLARAYDIGVWFLPSVCPETFSFATHETLATGLPVVSFDLGAQAETLSTAPNGYVLQVGPDETEAIATYLETLFTN
ncbi:MAG: glycosyltransferase [Paracoccaceae bacterium]